MCECATHRLHTWLYLVCVLSIFPSPFRSLLQKWYESIIKSERVCAPSAHSIFFSQAKHFVFVLTTNYRRINDTNHFIWSKQRACNFYIGKKRKKIPHKATYVQHIFFLILWLKFLLHFVSTLFWLLFLYFASLAHPFAGNFQIRLFIDWSYLAKRRVHGIND